jgi:hypothetical protein
VKPQRGDLICLHPETAYFYGLVLNVAEVNEEVTQLLLTDYEFEEITRDEPILHITLLSASGRIRLVKRGCNFRPRDIIRRRCDVPKRRS